jgi:hypothetical protein
MAHSGFTAISKSMESKARKKTSGSPCVAVALQNTNPFAMAATKIFRLKMMAKEKWGI